MIARQFEQHDGSPSHLWLVPIREAVRQQDDFAMHFLGDAAMLPKPIGQREPAKGGEPSSSVDADRGIEPTPDQPVACGDVRQRC